MIAIILLVIMLTLSLTFTRIGTLALVLTGMSEESAHFQARSDYYGVGFTTTESEMVVSHPVRRRIITLLMLLGNLGIATVMATVLGSFLSTNSAGQWARNLGILILGLSALWMAARSPWLYSIMSRLVTAALRRWTTLEAVDYTALLNLAAGYTVVRLRVEPDHWLVGIQIGELSLLVDGIVVLGIQRINQTFIGAPKGIAEIRADDVLIVYGPIQQLQELDCRRATKAAVGTHSPSMSDREHFFDDVLVSQSAAAVSAQ